MTEEEKVARLQELNAVQKEISLKKNRAHIGQIDEILIEGPSRRSLRDAMGRLENNKIVILPNTKFKPGTLDTVHIREVKGITLFGEPLNSGETEEKAIRKGVQHPVDEPVPLVNELD